MPIVAFSPSPLLIVLDYVFDFLPLRLGVALYSQHLCDHLFLTLHTLFAKMGFSVIVGTQRDDIRHSICAFLGQDDYVVALQIECQGTFC
jgi:hypothetical protein